MSSRRTRFPAACVSAFLAYTASAPPGAAAPAGPAETYVYDALGRLQQANPDYSQGATYSYDAADNRISMSGSSSGGGTGCAPGQTLTAQDGGANLVGGGGNDTLTGAHGADTMTGGACNDHFVFNELPWAPADIKDFTQGQDKIDLSALLAASGYSGTNPIADGYIKLFDNGSGGTTMYYDTDGPGTADMWGTNVATIEGIAPTSLTVADFITNSSSGGTSCAAGQVLTAQDGGANLIGGGGNDTLVGAHGADTMTGGACNDHFVFNELPWAPADIKDFTIGADKIDIKALISASGYTGTDPIADGYVKLFDNGSGGTTMYYDTDGPGTADMWGTNIATIENVAPSALTANDLILR